MNNFHLFKETRVRDSEAQVRRREVADGRHEGHLREGHRRGLQRRSPRKRFSFGAKFEMESASHFFHTGFPQVVDDLTPESYAEFMKERSAVVEGQKALLQAQREAKLLRTAT